MPGLPSVGASDVPGGINIRAGGTHCVLVPVELSAEAKEFMEGCATRILSIQELATFGTTHLPSFGQQVAGTLRSFQRSSLAQEILTALGDHDPQTWFTRAPNST